LIGQRDTHDDKLERGTLGERRPAPARLIVRFAAAAVKADERVEMKRMKQ
jgi:hypothetical protein